MKNRWMTACALAALSIGCIHVDGSPGGEQISRTSTPDDEFSAIELSGGFDRVEIEVCGECQARIKIEGDDRQVDEIAIFVDDGALELSHRSRLVVTDIDLVAQIRVPQLDRLVQAGGSDVSVSGVATEAFELINSGSGDIEVEGITGTFDGTVSGSGGVAAFELQASVVDLALSGSGDVEVCATERLRARSSGSGDVLYDCSPLEKDFDATGSGRISIR